MCALGNRTLWPTASMTVRVVGLRPFVPQSASHGQPASLLPSSLVGAPSDLWSLMSGSLVLCTVGLLFRMKRFQTCAQTSFKNGPTIHGYVLEGERTGRVLGEAATTPDPNEANYCNNICLSQSLQFPSQTIGVSPKQPPGHRSPAQ